MTLAPRLTFTLKIKLEDWSCNSAYLAWLQSYQQNFFLFSGQIFCFQKIPTDFSCCVPIKNFCKNFQESAPASCTKKSAQKIFLFYRKNLRFQNFLAFYRKIFRAENILGRIKSWSQISSKFILSHLKKSWLLSAYSTRVPWSWK